MLVESGKFFFFFWAYRHLLSAVPALNALCDFLDVFNFTPKTLNSHAG